MTTYCANGAKGCGDTYTCNTCRPPSATENRQVMRAEFAIAQLRHLYQQMLDGSVRDTAGAAKGLLGPAIEALENATARAEKAEAERDEARRASGHDEDYRRSRDLAVEAKTVLRICKWMRDAHTPHAQADAIERGDWKAREDYEQS